MAVAILVGSLGIGPGSVQPTPLEGGKVKVNFPEDLEKVKVKGGRALKPSAQVSKVLQVKVAGQVLRGRGLGTRKYVSTVAKLDINGQSA